MLVTSQSASMAVMSQSASMAVMSQSASMLVTSQISSMFAADRNKSVFFSVSLPKIGEGSGGVDVTGQLFCRTADIEVDRIGRLFSFPPQD